MIPEHAGRTVDRQTVYEDLVDVLQEYRGGVHAPDMAQALRRHATGSTVLAALDDDGRRAVFYDPKVMAVTAIPFDRHGLDHADRETVAWQVDTFGTWLDGNGEDLTWVHPRYGDLPTADSRPRPPSRFP
ncbi:hypothetical protein BRC81_08475 [Halobacteriales archaeon QS_1_68_20]|nr:MAG: hypothetical protein BRC81_08475 [Halobacteriales archaeon QS_1_68_20]